MIYSVWNPAARLYHYYEDNKPPTATPPTPSHLKGQPNELGWASDKASWKLPSGAKQIGTGQQARGMVATSDFDVGGLPWGLILAGVGIWFLVK